jgi:HNH endonuclease
MRRYLETEPVEAPAGRREGSEPPYTILYHQCPDCRRSHVATPDGLEEVEPEVVERVEGEAERVEINPAEEAVDAAPSEPVEIDPPNTPQLTRRVLLRDLLRCGNPHCGHTCGLHAHHIRWRSRGGKTALSNEVAVCVRCHALIHEGLLTVTVDPDGTLRWVAKADALDFALEKDVLSSALSRIAAAFTYLKAPARPTKDKVTSPPEALADLEVLVGGLERLGFSRREARERLLEAHGRLSEGGKTPTEEEVVREALRRSVPRSARAAPAA